MISVTLLVSALDRKSKRTSDTANLAIIIITKTIAALLLLGIAGLVYFDAGYTIYHIWQNTSGYVDVALVPMLAVLAFVIQMVLLGILAVKTKVPARTKDAVEALRTMAASGDDHLAPPAKLQPRLLEAHEISAEAITLKPIRQLVNPTMSFVFGLIFAFFFLSIFALPFSGLLFPTSTSYSNFASSISFAVVPLLFLIFAMLLVVLRLANLRGPATTVKVDALGVMWWRGRKAKHIAWSQARALAQIAYSPLTTSTNAATNTVTAYLLDGPDESLVWTVATTAKEQDFTASELLLRQIVTRTQLPLRDLTELAADVARYGSGNTARMLTSRVAVADDKTRLDAIRRALPEPETQIKRRFRPGVAFAMVAALAFIVADGALPLAANKVQAATQSYDASFVTTIHDKPPLFHDSLAHDDGLWQLAKADTRDPQNFTFAGGGYQLSENRPGDFVNSWQMDWYKDAAYEVTASETGTLPANQEDGVGLMFHGSVSGDTFTQFNIRHDGHWSLEYFNYVDDSASDNWHYLDSGFSTAIHQGFGVQNTLLVITQGDFIGLYANGILIENYRIYQQYDHVPVDGYAGVYSDQSGITATFTNYSVYALPKRPRFLDYLAPLMWRRIVGGG